MFDEERFRSTLPGYFEQLSMDRQLAEDCLHLYNSQNPGNEYEPAPGVVTKHYHFDNGICCLMATLWLVGSPLVASASCLLHVLSSFLSSLVEMVSMELSHAPP
ncbi:unnamed protein product [Urochloa humidicola]